MDSLSDRPPAEALDFVAGALHRLMPLAYALTGNAHDAEDLLQDCLTIVLTKWPKVAQATHRDAYVRRIMVNALTSRRRRRSSQEIPREDGGPERPGLEDTRVEDRDQLVRLLTGLPARQRAVLVLRYLEDLPDAQIAQALNCRQGTVRVLASRGLATLRARLGESAGPDRVIAASRR